MPIQRKPISIPSNQGSCCGKSYVQRQLIVGKNQSCCPPPSSPNFGSYDGSLEIYSDEFIFTDWCKLELAYTFNLIGGGRDTRFSYNDQISGWTIWNLSVLSVIINDGVISSWSFRLEGTTPAIVEIYAYNPNCAVDFGKVGQLQIV